MIALRRQSPSPWPNCLTTPRMSKSGGSTCRATKSRANVSGSALERAIRARGDRLAQLRDVLLGHRQPEFAERELRSRPRCWV